MMMGPHDGALYHLILNASSTGSSLLSMLSTSGHLPSSWDLRVGHPIMGWKALWHWKRKALSFNSALVVRYVGLIFSSL